MLPYYNPPIPQFLASKSDVEARAAIGAVAQTDFSAALSDFEMWGQDYLLSFNAKKAQLKAGAPISLSLGVVGDSWTQNSIRFIEPMTRYLQALLGDGGAGFCGFGYFTYSGIINGCADTARITGSRDTGGTWYIEASTVNGVYGMAGSHIVSSTVGDGVSLTINDTHDTCKIHYRILPGGGSFRYRVDSGSWVSVSTDGVAAFGLQSVTIPAAPFALRIEVETPGTTGVTLSGIDVRKSTGIVVHKLGASGGRVFNFSQNIPATYWQAGCTAMAFDCVSFMFGTNDQNGNVPPSGMAAGLVQMANRTRTARPLCDVAFMCPAKNGMTGQPYTMEEYRAAIFAKAVEVKAGFLDYMKSFGYVYADYAYSTDGSTRNLFNSDKLHPDPPTGGKLLTDRAIKFWTY